MSVILKLYMACDRCGRHEAVDTMARDVRDKAAPTLCIKPSGWIEPYDGHHLCPVCAENFLERRLEMDRELRELAGVETSEFDV